MERWWTSPLLYEVRILEVALGFLERSLFSSHSTASHPSAPDAAGVLWQADFALTFSPDGEGPFVFSACITLRLPECPVVRLLHVSLIRW